MKAKNVYQKYQVPPNLQLHMLRVASLANIICENWQGSQINKNLIVKTCLVHDIGNIVKFDLDKYPEFIDKKDRQINNWKKVQVETRKKYGNNDHIATIAIIKELKISDQINTLIDNISFINSCKAAKGVNFNLKICVYSDKRISPTGVVSLRDRLDEANQRYKNKPNSLNQKDVKRLIKCIYAIQKDVQKHVSIDLNKITNDDLEKNFNYLLNYEL